MKNFIEKGLFFLILLSFVFTALATWALGPQDVSNTPHNLSSEGPDVFMQYRSPDEDEVCIFCHTPHGGRTDAPLWNKNLSGSTFTHYNSATLSTAIGYDHGQKNINTESLLCLSCHDGTISMYDVINFSNRTGSDPAQAPGLDEGKMLLFGMDPDIPSKIIGDDLRNDHPVSFDYDDVYDDTTNSGALNTVVTATNKGVKFFGAKHRVECPSCHDPHVDASPVTGDLAYAPFLRTSNAGSYLCLACHIK